MAASRGPSGWSAASGLAPRDQLRELDRRAWERPRPPGERAGAGGAEGQALSPSAQLLRTPAPRPWRGPLPPWPPAPCPFGAPSCAAGAWPSCGGPGPFPCASSTPASIWELRGCLPPRWRPWPTPRTSRPSTVAWCAWAGGCPDRRAAPEGTARAGPGRW